MMNGKATETHKKPSYLEGLFALSGYMIATGAVGPPVDAHYQGTFTWWSVPYGIIGLAGVLMMWRVKAAEKAAEKLLKR